jgi:hypothetical protein
MCPLNPLYQNLSDFLGEKKVLDYYFICSLYVYSPFAFMVSLWYCRKNGVFHSFVENRFFLNRQGESRAILPTRQDCMVSNSGTKAASLLKSGNRGCVILSVSYRNVSAALNKVYNFIYSTGYLRSSSPDHQ